MTFWTPNRPLSSTVTVGLLPPTARMAAVPASTTELAMTGLPLLIVRNAQTDCTQFDADQHVVYSRKQLSQQRVELRKKTYLHVVS